MDLRQTTVVLLKLGAAAGAVALIAAVFLAADNPDDGVTEAHADIVALDWLPKSKHQRFVDTLRQQTMSRPRSYDWNGNKVFFSTKSTDKSPLQVLRDLQDAFVLNGVNQRTYLGEAIGSHMLNGPESFRAGADAYKGLIAGDMVPMAVRADRVVMTGVELADGADVEDVVSKMLVDREQLPEMVEQLRYVEAFQTEPQGKTTINAVWSDDELDLRGFDPNHPNEQSIFSASVDPDVPLCPGCTRKRRFAGEGEESGYVESIYVGQLSARSALDFYVRELPAQGWQPSHSQRLMAAAEEQKLRLPAEASETFLAFARDGEQLQVLIYRDTDAGHTVVHTMRLP